LHTQKINQKKRRNGPWGDKGKMEGKKISRRRCLSRKKRGKTEKNLQLWGRGGKGEQHRQTFWEGGKSREAESTIHQRRKKGLMTLRQS